MILAYRRQEISATRPVSYTHLDVYKRQALLLPQPVEACENHHDPQASQAAYRPLKPLTHLTAASHIEGTRAALAAVSYTHLLLTSLLQVTSSNQVWTISLQYCELGVFIDSLADLYTDSLE